MAGGREDDGGQDIFCSRLTLSPAPLSEQQASAEAVKGMAEWTPRRVARNPKTEIGHLHRRVHAASQMIQNPSTWNRLTLLASSYVAIVRHGPSTTR